MKKAAVWYNLIISDYDEKTVNKIDVRNQPNKQAVIYFVKDTDDAENRDKICPHYHRNRHLSWNSDRKIFFIVN